MLAAHKDKLTCEICNKLFHRVRARQNHYSYHHGDRNKEKHFEWAKCGENTRGSIQTRLQSIENQFFLDNQSQSDCEPPLIDNCDDAEDRSPETATGEDSKTG